MPSGPCVLPCRAPMRLQNAKPGYWVLSDWSHQFWSAASTIMTTASVFLIMLSLRCQSGSLVLSCPAVLALPLCQPMKGVTRSPVDHALVPESLRALSWYQLATPNPSAADAASLWTTYELFLKCVGQSPAPPAPLSSSRPSGQRNTLSLLNTLSLVALIGCR